MLGDMLELGEISRDSHLEVGGLVKSNKVDILVTVGVKSELIAEGADKESYGCVKIYKFSTTGEAVEFLDKNIKPDDTILVKASRAMHFENIIDGLKEKSEVRSQNTE